MRRRLIGAIDLGLREGELLAVQVKRVDCDTWRITLSPEVANGGATTDKAEFVYAMTERVQEVRHAAPHKDIKTTARYMTAREERVRALMGKMG